MWPIFTMNTRNGGPDGESQLSQQQRNDLLLDVFQKLGSMSSQLSSLSKRVDVVWDQLIDKPESSVNRGKGERTEAELEQETEFQNETPDGHTLNGPNATLHHGYQNHQTHQIFQPNFKQRTPWQPVVMERMETQGYRIDDITKRV